MSTHGCNVPCQKKGGGQERKAQSSLGRGLSLSRGAGKAWIVTSHPSAIGKNRILVQNPQPLASNLLLFIFLTFEVLEIFSALSLSCPKKADTYMWTSEASFWVTWNDSISYQLLTPLWRNTSTKAQSVKDATWFTSKWASRTYTFPWSWGTGKLHLRGMLTARGGSHTSNPSTQKVEVGSSLWVQSQSGLYNAFQASHSEILSQKNK